MTGIVVVVVVIAENRFQSSNLPPQLSSIYTDYSVPALANCLPGEVPHPARVPRVSSTEYSFSASGSLLTSSHSFWRPALQDGWQQQARRDNGRTPGTGCSRGSCLCCGFSCLRRVPIRLDVVVRPARRRRRIHRPADRQRAQKTPRDHIRHGRRPAGRRGGIGNPPHHVQRQRRYLSERGQEHNTHRAV